MAVRAGDLWLKIRSDQSQNLVSLSLSLSPRRKVARSAEGIRFSWLYLASSFVDLTLAARRRRNEKCERRGAPAAKLSAGSKNKMRILPTDGPLRLSRFSTHHRETPRKPPPCVESSTRLSLFLSQNSCHDARQRRSQKVKSRVGLAIFTCPRISYKKVSKILK